MSNGFHPGQGGPLAPPGFERKDPRPDSPDYVARHPTRYDWREDIEELIRLIYRQFGGPDEQQMNTYGGGQYRVVRCGNATVIKTLSHNGRGISENRPKARRTPTLNT